MCWYVYLGLETETAPRGGLLEKKSKMWALLNHLPNSNRVTPSIHTIHILFKKLKGEKKKKKTSVFLSCHSAGKNGYIPPKFV